jgi:hypothetical protein
LKPSKSFSFTIITILFLYFLGPRILQQTNFYRIEADQQEQRISKRHEIKKIYESPILNNIVDLNLKDCITSQLQITNIKNNDPALDITRLNCKQKIIDLSGLEHLINLKGLSLFQADLVDLQALSHLNMLSSIDIKYSTISDISAVTKLHNLKSLTLSGSEIGNLLSLKKINSNLETFTLPNYENYFCSEINAIKYKFEKHFQPAILCKGNDSMTSQYPEMNNKEKTIEEKIKDAEQHFDKMRNEYLLEHQ